MRTPEKVAQKHKFLSLSLRPLSMAWGGKFEFHWAPDEQFYDRYGCTMYIVNRPLSITSCNKKISTKQWEKHSGHSSKCSKGRRFLRMNNLKSLTLKWQKYLHSSYFLPVKVSVISNSMTTYEKQLHWDRSIGL